MRSGRVPAAELEAVVAETIAKALDDPVALCAEGGFSVSPSLFKEIARNAAEHAERLRQRDRTPLRVLVKQVQILEDCIRIDCATSTLATLLNAGTSNEAVDAVQLVSNIRLKRSGHVLRLIHTSGAAAAPAPAPSLIKLLVKARRWWSDLRRGELDVTTLARREGVSRSYVCRVVRLAFLAPAVVEAILSGRTRAEVDGILFTSTGAVDAAWPVQVERLMPG